MEKAYWAFRAGHQEYSNYIWSELQAGRLRMGWGYDESQDLRKLQAIIDADPEWWEHSNQDLKLAASNLKMLDLGSIEKRMKEGDVVLVPNLPQPGSFVLVEISGPYAFNIEDFKLNNGEDAWDMGHILPVKLHTTQGINKHNENVHADIRRTLRCRSRIWSLDKYAAHIETLLSKASNEDLTSEADASGKIKTAFDESLDQAKKVLRKTFGEQLKAGFKAAEWEEPIAVAFEGLYPGATVTQTGGPNENGADVVVELGHPEELPLRSMKLLLQVKDYSGIIDGEGAVEQLRQAIDHYGDADTTLLGAFVLTTADTVGDTMKVKLTELQAETSVPTGCLTKEKLVSLLTEGFSIGMLNKT